MANKPPKEEAVKDPNASGSSWSSQSNRYSDDQLLRRYGFKIHARPKGGGEALWILINKVYTQTQALEVARRRRCAESLKASP
jgi:hypothetical protein